MRNSGLYGDIRAVSKNRDCVIARIRPAEHHNSAKDLRRRTLTFRPRFALPDGAFVYWYGVTVLGGELAVPCTGDLV